MKKIVLLLLALAVLLTPTTAYAAPRITIPQAYANTPKASGVIHSGRMIGTGGANVVVPAGGRVKTQCWFVRKVTLWGGQVRWMRYYPSTGTMTTAHPTRVTSTTALQPGEFRYYCRAIVFDSRGIPHFGTIVQSPKLTVRGGW